MANSNHACVNTKLLAMKSKMLGTQDYEALIKAPSLNDLFYYLKDNTYYGPFLEEVHTDHLHRLELEVPLTRGTRAATAGVFGAVLLLAVTAVLRKVRRH